MNRLFSATIVAAVLALSLSAGFARAEDARVAKGREVLKDHASAVVTVTATGKIKLVAMGQEQDGGDQPITTQGTVIDPTGLTVLACSTIDPSGMLKSALAGAKGPDGQPIKVDIQSDVTDIKLRMADGTEVPARLVMKDEDLDLAFIRPDNDSDAGKKLAGQYPCVKIEETPDPQPLETIYSLTRMGQAMNWQVAVRMQEISVVVKKPQKRYVASALPAGSPVFNADGKPLGMVVNQKQSSAQGGGKLGALSKMLGGDGAAGAVILPVGEIAESARQAPAKAATTEPATEK